jgi:hypothetical protein
MILVHEAMFDCKEAKLVTVVKVSAGTQSVRTDANSNGIFQQPLHIDVEQGTEFVTLELLDMNSTVLAELKLEVAKDLVARSLQPETIHVLRLTRQGKRADITNPKLKVTMVVGNDDRTEEGLLSETHMSQEVDILVRQQLRKAKEDRLASNAGTGSGDEEASPQSDLEVLKRAGAGPLEVFEGLGKTTSVYVAVLGPPETRRWILSVHQDVHDCACRKNPMLEVDLLKVESVQADPTRHHVFVVNYYDQGRVRQTLTFRRMDRARDVWVEILHLLVQKARDAKDQKANLKAEMKRGHSMIDRSASSSFRVRSRASGRSSHAGF